MSGTILIGEKNSIPLSTVAFDRLVEKIRAEFMGDESKYMDDIYSPLDDGGMTFISLKTQNGEGFRAFCRAVDRAYKKEASEESFHKYNDIWQTLMESLKSDSRHTEAV
jgi:hypothetical protein